MNRQEYLDAGKGRDDWREVQQAAHRQYYGQFITDAMRADVVKFFGLDALKQAAAHDGEGFRHSYLNTIPLSRWDTFAAIYLKSVPLIKALREAGDCYSPSSATCIAKEAANQVLEAQA